MKQIDTLKLIKYITCYIAQYRQGDFDYFVKNALAPLEHLFDPHVDHDKQWYWHKELEDISQQFIETAKNKKVKR